MSVYRPNHLSSHKAFLHSPFWHFLPLLVVFRRPKSNKFPFRQNRPSVAGIPLLADKAVCQIICPRRPVFWLASFFPWKWSASRRRHLGSLAFAGIYASAYNCPNGRIPNRRQNIHRLDVNSKPSHNYPDWFFKILFYCFTKLTKILGNWGELKSKRRAVWSDNNRVLWCDRIFCDYFCAFFLVESYAVILTEMSSLLLMPTADSTWTTSTTRTAAAPSTTLPAATTSRSIQAKNSHLFGPFVTRFNRKIRGQDKKTWIPWWGWRWWPPWLEVRPSIVTRHLSSESHPNISPEKGKNLDVYGLNWIFSRLATFWSMSIERSHHLIMTWKPWKIFWILLRNAMFAYFIFILCR